MALQAGSPVRVLGGFSWPAGGVALRRERRGCWGWVCSMPGERYARWFPETDLEIVPGKAFTQPRLDR